MFDVMLNLCGFAKKKKKKSEFWHNDMNAFCPFFNIIQDKRGIRIG